MTRTSAHGFDLTRNKDEWHTRIALPFWRPFLWEGPGDLVEVDFLQDPQALDAPPSEAQLVTLRELGQQQEALFRAVVPAMRGHYDDTRPLLIEADLFEAPEEEAPEAPDAARFAGLHLLQRLFVHRTQKHGRVYVGFSFWARWEREHGVGVLVHGTRIVDVGEAAISFIGWNADEDAEKP